MTDKEKMLRDAAQNARIADACRRSAERMFRDGNTTGATEQIARAQALEKQAQELRLQALAPGDPNANPHP